MKIERPLIPLGLSSVTAFPLSVSEGEVSRPQLQSHLRVTFKSTSCVLKKQKPNRVENLTELPVGQVLRVSNIPFFRSRFLVSSRFVNDFVVARAVATLKPLKTGRDVQAILGREEGQIGVYKHASAANEVLVLVDKSCMPLARYLVASFALLQFRESELYSDSFAFSKDNLIIRSSVYVSEYWHIVKGLSPVVDWSLLLQEYPPGSTQHLELARLYPSSPSKVGQRPGHGEKGGRRLNDSQHPRIKEDVNIAKHDDDQTEDETSGERKAASYSGTRPQKDLPGPGKRLEKLSNKLANKAGQKQETLRIKNAIRNNEKTSCPHEDFNPEPSAARENGKGVPKCRDKDSALDNNKDSVKDSKKDGSKDFAKDGNKDRNKGQGIYQTKNKEKVEEKNKDEDKCEGEGEGEGEGECEKEGKLREPEGVKEAGRAGRMAEDTFTEAERLRKEVETAKQTIAEQEREREAYEEKCRDKLHQILSNTNKLLEGKFDFREKESSKLQEVLQKQTEMQQKHAEELRVLESELSKLREQLKTRQALPTPSDAMPVDIDGMVITPMRDGFMKDEQIQTEYHGNACLKCKQHPPDIVHTPCNHLLYCNGCWDEISRQSNPKTRSCDSCYQCIKKNIHVIHPLT